MLPADAGGPGATILGPGPIGADLTEPPDPVAARFKSAPLPAEVGAALAESRLPAPGQFTIALPVRGGYFALDDAGRPALLIPVADGGSPVGRDVGGLSLHHERAIQFRLAQGTSTSAAAVVTCTDKALLPTFCVLALDVAARSAGPDGTHALLPPVRRVFDAVSEWERLLRARRRLSAEEELGLWGELWLLAKMADVDAAVRAWRGPSGAAADFVYDGRSLECKTTTQRLRHQVSQAQVERPYGDLAPFVASLWVGADPSGKSLPDLVRRIDVSLSDGAAFESRLLQAGYSRLDAGSYRERFVVLEAPLVFRTADVPRVRQWDSGVSAIRFTAQLDGERALPVGEAEALLRGPGQVQHAAQQANGPAHSAV